MTKRRPSHENLPMEKFQAVVLGAPHDPGKNRHIPPSPERFVEMGTGDVGADARTHPTTLLATKHLDFIAAIRPNRAMTAST